MVRWMTLLGSSQSRLHVGYRSGFLRITLSATSARKFAHFVGMSSPDHPELHRKSDRRTILQARDTRLRSVGELLLRQHMQSACHAASSRAAIDPRSEPRTARNSPAPAAGPVADRSAAKPVPDIGDDSSRTPSLCVEQCFSRRLRPRASVAVQRAEPSGEFHVDHQLKRALTPERTAAAQSGTCIERSRRTASTVAARSRSCAMIAGTTPGCSRKRLIETSCHTSSWPCFAVWPFLVLAFGQQLDSRNRG